MTLAFCEFGCYWACEHRDDGRQPHRIDLPGSVRDLVARLAADQPIYVFDQSIPRPTGALITFNGEDITDRVR